MQQTTASLIEVRWYQVNCQINDRFDDELSDYFNYFPQYLGYSFAIDTNEDIGEAKTYIKELLKKYGQPLVSISTDKKISKTDSARIWTRERIESSIRRGYL